MDMMILPIFLIIWILAFVIGGYVLYLVIKALKTYIRANALTKEKQQLILSLAENIKHYRTEKQMTQEFVAESLGVSRQSVSKWENGTSDPSTSNLIALAQLLEVDVKQLIGN